MSWINKQSLYTGDRYSEADGTGTEAPSTFHRVNTTETLKYFTVRSKVLVKNSLPLNHIVQLAKD